MANTKSAIKAARKSQRLHDRNQALRTRLKTLQKKLAAAAAGTANSKVSLNPQSKSAE